MNIITVTQLADWLAQDDKPLLLDVREPDEFAFAHIAGSTSMPMGDVPQRYQELDDERDIVCICHHGIRSAQVVNYLQHQDFEQVYNLQGGVDAWATQVDIDMPRY